MSTRTPLMAGNWKMHHGPAAAARLTAEIGAAASSHQGVDVALFVPFVSLSAAVSAAGRNLQVGAQNAHERQSGAFTGEVSCAMLAEVCPLVLLGHSERRHLYGESSTLIGSKVATALESGLEVVLCVGETLDERESGATLEVVSAQLAAGLDSVGGEQVSRVTIAYEPVWAIGTGRNATPRQAGYACRAVRDWLRDRYGDAADVLRILYGGSVNPGNWAEIAAEPDVDGALVGGASLEAESFNQLIAISAAA
ncbi:MAG: triose-phosphate isomerase [Chloroflexota bacterium]|nr:triose-phosphate isomerase [Chloroflexota bacterium]